MPHMLRAGDFVTHEANECVPGVEVRVAVVGLEVSVVLGKSAAIGGDFIESVRPGVNSLRGEAVPVGDANLCLKRVVVCCADAFKLVDVAVLRIQLVVTSSGLALRVCG